MHISPTIHEVCAPMSVETKPPVPAGRQTGKRTYPLRTVARVFGALGIAALFYASALVALAIEMTIIEF